MFPLRHRGCVLLSDSPARVRRVEEGKFSRGGVLAGERFPLQGNEWQSVCYSGNHSSRALLSPCQINEVSHYLELLALFGNMQNKNCAFKKQKTKTLHYHFLNQNFNIYSIMEMGPFFSLAFKPP